MNRAVSAYQHSTRIASRGLKLRILLLLLIFVVVIFVFSVMALNIHNRAAENSVLSRANQTAERFYSHINKTLVLVQKAAHSNDLKLWFGDEGNEEKRINAYYEMLDYSSVLPNPHLYFGIQDSLGDYSFVPGITLEEFTPYKKLDPNEYWDSWYFECAASDKDYLLNFDKDLDTQIWKLWLNHKVWTDSKLSGVFCAAFEIEDLRRELFAGFDQKRERVFVIDEKGAILMSSDPMEYYRRETETHIGDICEDKDFISVIEKTGAERNAGFPEAGVAKSALTPFRYNAVSRIPATGWSVVVFFDSNYLTGLAGMLSFLPLPLVLLVSLVVFAAVSSILMSRHVFRPLERLTRSIAESDIDSLDIYGHERLDELGELSREIRESRRRLNNTCALLYEMNRKKNEQERLLYAANGTAEVLLTSPDDEEKFRDTLLRQWVL